MCEDEMYDIIRGYEESERDYHERNIELENENAKLRELVRGMCDLLPHADWPSTECDEKASACIDQAIELGIEVDE